MFRLNCEIEIETKTEFVYFRAVESIEISSGWEQLTQTAKIRVPDRFTRDGKKISVGSDGFFKRGDKIKISIGYLESTPQLTTIFVGYITKISVNSMIEIMCDDLTFELKQKTFTKTFSNITLENLLKQLMIESGSKMNYKVSGNATTTPFTQYQVNTATAAMAFDDLKKNGFHTFYTLNENKLICGFPYLHDRREHTFDFEFNVIDDDLVVYDKNEIKFRIVYRTITKTGEKLEVVLGDPDGETKVFERLNIKDQTALKALAENKLKEYKRDGLSGSFTTFIDPIVNFGDIVNLRSKKYPEKNGSFYVKKVETTFGVNGGRQKIHLDRIAQ